MLERPGVARGRGDPVLGIARQRELWCVRRTEDDESRFLHPRHHMVVDVGDLIDVHGRSLRATDVLDAGEVLDRDRHAM